MWVAKIKLDASKAFLGQIAIKNKITAAGYPLKFWKKGKQLFVLLAGHLYGSEKNKKGFIKDLQASGKVPNLEVTGDFIMMVFQEKPYADPYYRPEIIWLKPAIISHEGYELLEIASWSKEPLRQIIALAQKHLSGKLLKLAEEKVGSIGIVSIVPELTEKQRKALQLAVENGYYEYPRKVELKALAKMMKISYATYQAHLRKSERTLLPFIFARFN